jgi:hypothetical protein
VLPTALVVRTSSRERRLVGVPVSVELAAGPWGTVHSVTGHGSQIGIVLSVAPGRFCGAHVLPDGAHLVLGRKEAPAPRIRDLYVSRSARLFAVGDEGQEDLLLTSRTRWFRARNNPHFLGFSKGDR